MRAAGICEHDTPETEARLYRTALPRNLDYRLVYVYYVYTP